MKEVSTIGLDLAKHVFQAHGADAGGDVVFRKQLRRDKVLAFFAQQPACLVAMEACASAHCEVTKGSSNVAGLVEHAQASGSSVPTAAHPALDILVKMPRVLEAQIKELDIEIAQRAREEEVARRLILPQGQQRRAS